MPTSPNLRTRASIAAGVCAALLPLSGHSSGTSASPRLRVNAPAPPLPIPVFVAIAPQAFLAESIAGPHAAVSVLVRQNQDPHLFEPTPSQLSALAAARVYFRIGMPFESQLLKRIRPLCPALRIEDPTASIPRRAMAEEHDAHGESPHAGERGDPDPHVWMAPGLLATQAVSIAAVLTDLDPAHADVFGRNLKDLLARLNALDARLRDSLTPFKGRTFCVFHPSFGYFADAYDLRQMPVEIEGKSPSPRQLAELTRQLRANRIALIIVQPQFDTHAAAALAKTVNATIAPVDPMSADILDSLETLGQLLRRSFAAAPPAQP